MLMLILTLLFPQLHARQVVKKTDYAICRDSYLRNCQPVGWQRVVDTDFLCLRRRLEHVDKDCLTLLQAKAKDPCVGDIVRFCEGNDRNAGHAVTCLETHLPKLAPACKQVLDEDIAQRPAETQACGADLTKLCADRPAHTQKQCLYAAWSQGKVSADCTTYLDRRFKKN